MLGPCAEWSPEPGPLTVVAPHPDDEVLGAGGLVSSWTMAGHSVTVLSVTDGKAADSRQPHPDWVRRGELRDALRTLCPVHVPVDRLGIPDGRIRDHANRLRYALGKYADSRGTIIAPFDHDGHPDHEIVGRVCREVAESQGMAIARYPVWTGHHRAAATQLFRHWRRFSLSAPAQRAKSRALRCFKTLLTARRGRALVPHVLAQLELPYEAFML